MYIELKKALKKYGTGNTLVYALNNVDLSIERGEVAVILGPSGSGKSTLMNMIGGIDHIDSGQIIIDDQNISDFNDKKLTEYRRNNVGFIFQFYNLIQDLTAKENIETVLDISNDPLDINEVMKALDISQLKDRFPSELSGGQQQRIAIARAIIKNPKILLCDELTGALDSASSIEVLKYIEIINKKFNTTILIITHNESISKIANRIIRIKDGHITDNYINTNIINSEELIL